jgi:hypothetical protein
VQGRRIGCNGELRIALPQGCVSQGNLAGGVQLLKLGHVLKQFNSGFQRAALDCGSAGEFEKVKTPGVKFNHLEQVPEYTEGGAEFGSAASNLQSSADLVRLRRNPGK